MIDLKSFCSSEKKSCLEPYSIGDKTFATDGRVMVRVPRVDGVDERECAPPVDRLPFDHDQLSNWVELPNWPEEWKPCRECRGSGFVVVCPECEGTGEAEASNGFNYYDVDCKSCDCGGTVPSNGAEKAAIKCDLCCGTGAAARSIEIGRNGADGLNVVYLKILHSLPGIKISTDGDAGTPFRFRFEGGDGLVMPMNFREDA